MVSRISLCYPSNTNNKQRVFFRFNNCPLRFEYPTSRKSCSTSITYAKKKKNSQQDSLKLTIMEEVSEDGEYEDVDEYEEDGLLVTDDLDDEEFLDDGDHSEDEYEIEDAEVFAGDGAEGGGISLAGTWWDKEALAIARGVTESFEGEFGIYAFRTLANARIQVRIEKLSTKSGSPSLDDIEAFSAAFRERLDEAELAKTIPENISLEVSSPGVERVVRIPQDLDRFKERPMFVKYITEVAETGSRTESDGILRLVSVDLETKCCEWGVADVKVNREKAGKGRPLSKKQREWRLTTPFDSIRLVRLYSEM